MSHISHCQWRPQQHPVLSMQRTRWIALLQPLLIVLFSYTSMCNFQLSPGGICTQQVTGTTLSRKVRWYWIGQGSQPIHWSSFPNGSSSFGASKIPPVIYGFPTSTVAAKPRGSQVHSLPVFNFNRHNSTCEEERKRRLCTCCPIFKPKKAMLFTLLHP